MFEKARNALKKRMEKKPENQSRRIKARVPLLINTLMSEKTSSSEREEAAKALAQVNLKKGLRKLGEIIEKNKDDGKKFYYTLRAIAAVSAIGRKEGIPVLEKTCNAKNGLIRSKAIDAMAEIGGEEIIPVLEKMAKNEKNKGEMTCVVDALGSTKSVKAIPVLKHVLRNDEEDGFVKLRTIRRLGEIGHLSVIPEFEEIIKHDPKEVFRRQAIEAIHAIGHPDGILALEHVVKNEKENARLRELAIKALGEIRHPNGIPALEYAIKNDKNEHASKRILEPAIKALGEIGHPDGMPALEHAIKDERGGIRLIAADAIEEIAGKLPKTHALNKTLKIIHPSTHPKSFIALKKYVEETKGRKPAAHYCLYAKQLKAAEPVVKREAA